ncbi:M23 family metallopeptidase [Allobranchiibius sp. CTAmp26]|uniref:M23 family metallopeptidase n=1 Tax=Allobranchiibius sp. CTAmp26 TaxID=2815214 RepID=UPI001AA1623A|nr:M23 family metallopeptidase [Allobranchiibius sp. CTAmp26]MBO1754214.1 M23 family metallopeptidase [Allobranchiibius sp. CTAmp26]
MSRAVGRHRAGAPSIGAHRRAAPRFLGRITLPSAAAITVSVVAVGAAGAATIDSRTTPAMSLGERAVVAAPTSRATVRSTPTPSTSKATAKPAATAQPVVSPWTCPIAGCAGRFTSPFGSRWGTQHLGDDFATPMGTPLHALHDSTVVATGFYAGMGNRVELDLGDGVLAVYAHMSRIDVTVGERVSMGEVVGRSGNTGHSTGPHLHLEIHLSGTPVDPAPWLRAHHIF